MATITKRGNITFPVRDLIVHAMPISYAAYQSVAMTLAATLSKMQDDGIDPQQQTFVAIYAYKELTGPVIEAEAAAVKRNPLFPANKTAAVNGFLSELLRLTWIIKDGETLLFSEAENLGLIDEENKDYILSQLIFFTLACYQSRKIPTESLIAYVSFTNGMQTTFLNVTEYAKSLTTLTGAETTS